MSAFQNKGILPIDRPCPGLQSGQGREPGPVAGFTERSINVPDILYGAG